MTLTIQRPSLHLQYQDRDWRLFNDYRSKRMARGDQQQLTRFDTLLVQAKSDQRWYLYQTEEGR